MERLCQFGADELILPFPQEWPAGGELSLAQAISRIERTLIRQAISDCNGDKARAAKRLGMGLSSLYRKLET